jgi:hypothetical protein
VIRFELDGFGLFMLIVLVCCIPIVREIFRTPKGGDR